jgi:integrase
MSHTERSNASRAWPNPTPPAAATGTAACPATPRAGAGAKHCRRAYAVYRARRRGVGKDNPRQLRSYETDGHISGRWFRDQPALERSGIGAGVRMHGLRHAHASCLLAGGADLQVVKERLGDGSIATTEKYRQNLPDADDTAIAALARMRRTARRLLSSTAPPQ